MLASIFTLGPILRRSILILVILVAPVTLSLLPRANVSLPGYISFFLIGFLLADLYLTKTTAARSFPDIADALGLSGTVLLFSLPSSKVTYAILPFVIGTIFFGALWGNRFRSFTSVRALTWIGGMCYSIYLIHYPIISFVADHVSPTTSPAIAWIITVAIALPALLLVSLVFFLLIERPCMDPNWPRKLLQSLTGLRQRS